MPESLPYLQTKVPDQCQAIDEDFFIELLKSHLAELTYFVFQIVDDTAIAEELASEAFLKLWINREKLLNVSAARSFLYSIVKNAAMDHIRRLKVIRQRAHEIQTHQDTSDQSMEEALIKTEVVAELYKALQSLPPQYQHVIKLEYLEGRSIKEIAAAMNISVNTVKTYRMRGIQKLRKWLTTVPVFSIIQTLFF